MVTISVTNVLPLAEFTHARAKRQRPRLGAGGHEICLLLPRMLPQVIFEVYREGRTLDKCLKSLAPRAGFEPATNRLTAGCSTTELPGNKPMLRQGGL